MTLRRSPVKSLQRFGQSPWLDFISRNLVRSGELGALQQQWGLRGVTSNPAIFERAIDQGEDYDDAIHRLAHDGRSAQEIYEALVLEDVGTAADLFRLLYEETGGEDGFVSLEVSPRLAHDVEGTCFEARRLWAALARPNVMIKVPATDAGLGAIRRLLAEGVNVNVTLLFSLDRYRQVAEAHLAGLEAADATGRRLLAVASVASFFLSRIDTLVDAALEGVVAGGGAAGALAAGLRGEVAIASARRAYLIFEETTASDRFRRLAASGARPQRLLWASTGTKNPKYSDLKYVEPLIGPRTVNTMPLATLEAYHDHGHPADRLTENPERAAEVLEAVAEVGLDLDALTSRLLEEGLTKFVEPFDALLAEIERRREKALRDRAKAEQRPSHRQGSISREHFDAVLFDLDGVLTDTASLHALCWKQVFDEVLERWAKQRGEPFRPFDIEGDYLRYVDGKPRLDGARDFLVARGIERREGSGAAADLDSLASIAERKDALFERALESEGVRVYEGSVRWVRQLRSVGFRTAVVSASHHCAAVLHAAGIGDLFDAQVDGDLAERLQLAGKPAPDTFLEAARQLGVAAVRAIVVEDAIAGVRAGRAGDFGLVIGVVRRGAPDALALSGADRVVRDLEEMLV
jgi:transaldolase